MLTDNTISTNNDDEDEKKEELYDLYQQIVLLMKDIIEMIDLDKFDEIDNDIMIMDYKKNYVFYGI